MHNIAHACHPQENTALIKEINELRREVRSLRVHGGAAKPTSATGGAPGGSFRNHAAGGYMVGGLSLLNREVVPLDLVHHTCCQHHHAHVQAHGTKPIIRLICRLVTAGWRRACGASWRCSVTSSHGCGRMWPCVTHACGSWRRLLSLRHAPHRVASDCHQLKHLLLWLHRPRPREASRPCRPWGLVARRRGPRA